MNDYERIARVIRYLDENHEEQPDLAVLAAHAGLSPYHFHRLFSTWAGITPKDFLQCLTVSHAKQLLREGESVLGAALAAGLSGPGRLHDLCVTLEAASPGEWKSGGENWTIAHGFADTPIGRCLIAEGPRGICHVAFVDQGEEKPAVDDLQNAWPNANHGRDDMMATNLARRIFRRDEPDPSEQPLRAYVRGTRFQVKVWRALLQVPKASLVSYGQLARSVGQPEAARAVGTAVGRNPLACLIPCHRVIRETGVFGNYRWGAVRKRIIVAWENGCRSVEIPGRPGAGIPNPSARP